MAFLDFFRAKRKTRPTPLNAGTTQAARSLPRLPENVVEIIIGFVNQQISTVDAKSQTHCQACAIRDLSRCSLVDQAWCQKANRVLYASVDVDASHSCRIVSIVANPPRRRIQGRTSQRTSTRLQLFLRTINENKRLGNLVIVLKAACVSDHSSLTHLARLVRSLPQLREIDLPLSFYKGTSSTLVLRQELEANCPHIRSTVYCSGAGLHFNSLAKRNCWPYLEKLELSAIDTDVFTLRKILGGMTQLSVLKLSQMQSGDRLFGQMRSLPGLPPLQELYIEDDLAVTSTGLIFYLSCASVAASLRHLSVVRTGVSVLDVHSILAKAFNLESMALTQEIDCSLYMQQQCSQQCCAISGEVENTPRMASVSLQIFTFDISPSRNSSWTDAESYYAYLLPSVQGNLFPNLRKLYVLDTDFVNKLIHPMSFPSRNSFVDSKVRMHEEPLEVFVKGSSELPWSSATLATYYTSNTCNQIDRPVNASDISRGGNPWTGEARKSVLLGNGLGSFFAIPQAPADLNVSVSWKTLEPNNAFITTGRLDISERRDRRSRMDLWR